jgi:zinc protease
MNFFNLLKLLILLINFLVLSSCVSTKQNIVESAKPKSAVKLNGLNQIKLKPYKEVVLENGLKIFFIKDMTLPRINLSLLVKVGQRDEKMDTLGINYLTASLLEEGTSQYNSNQLADQLASLGTDLSILPGPDYSIISIDGLTLSSEKMIDLFSEILFKPSFKDSEVKKIKEQILSSIKKVKDNPSQLADIKIDQVMFKDHPFSYPSYGDEKSIKKIRRVDIIKHYLNYYRPNNSYLAVSGALTETLESKVTDVFKEWPSRKIETEVVPYSFKSSQDKYFIYYKKGSVQSEIRVSFPLFPRNHPDHLKLRVANEIFGGGFVSRLNSKIRDQMGLTYSISSSVEHRKDLGTFDIGTFTKNTSTRAVLDQIQKELQLYILQGISAKELAAAKNLLTAQFPRSLETVDSLAFNLMYLDFHNISFNYLNDYYKNIEKLTVEDINDVIKTYFQLDQAKYFILADDSIKDQIKELNPQEVK